MLPLLSLLLLPLIKPQLNQTSIRPQNDEIIDYYVDLLDQSQEDALTFEPVTNANQYEVKNNDTIGEYVFVV